MSLLVCLLLFAVALGGHVVGFVAIVNRTHAYGWPRKLVDLITVACGVCLLIGLWPVFQFAAADLFPSGLLQLPQTLVNGYGWSAIVVAVVAITHNAWRWLHSERRGGAANCRTTLLELGDSPSEDYLAAGVPQLMGRLPGNQVIAPQLVQLDLLVPGLPAAFDGLTIAHLTDLHMSGRITRAYFDQIVMHTNRLEPDIIAVTGDIVERNECLGWIDESLANLVAKQAKLFVLGNHDVKSDPAEIRSRLVAGGFVDVGGQVTTITLSQGECVVAGNEAPWFLPVPDVSNLKPREPSVDILRLALLHTPDHFSWAQQHGFHVALAGHNHGGQIRFPILGALLAPSIYGTRYASGVFCNRGTTMHVSPGTSSLTPARWKCPPELNLLTLRCG